MQAQNQLTTFLCKVVITTGLVSSWLLSQVNTISKKIINLAGFCLLPHIIYKSAPWCGKNEAGCIFIKLVTVFILIPTHAPITAI